MKQKSASGMEESIVSRVKRSSQISAEHYPIDVEMMGELDLCNFRVEGARVCLESAGSVTEATSSVATHSRS